MKVSPEGVNEGAAKLRMGSAGQQLRADTPLSTGEGLKCKDLQVTPSLRGPHEVLVNNSPVTALPTLLLLVLLVRREREREKELSTYV